MSYYLQLFHISSWNKNLASWVNDVIQSSSFHVLITRIACFHLFRNTKKNSDLFHKVELKDTVLCLYKYTLSGTKNQACFLSAPLRFCACFSRQALIYMLIALLIYCDRQTDGRRSRSPHNTFLV